MTNFSIQQTTANTGSLTRVALGLSFLAIALFSLGLLSCEPKEQNPTETNLLLTINKEPITLEDIDAEIRLAAGDILKWGKAKHEIDAIRKSFLDETIRRRLLVLEAKRRNILVANEELQERAKLFVAEFGVEDMKTFFQEMGIEKKPFLRLVGEEILVEKFLQRDIYPRILVKDDEIKAFFNENKARFVRPEMVRVYQIVVANEEAARKAYKRLLRREKFETVAREVSIAPESERGGDLGWVSRKKMPDPFGNLIFELPRKTINRPVKSNYGYHIFKVTEHLSEKSLKIEEVWNIIQKELYEKKKIEAEHELLEVLKRRYDLQISENAPIQPSEEYL